MKKKKCNKDGNLEEMGTKEEKGRSRRRKRKVGRRRGEIGGYGGEEKGMED